VAAFPGRRRPKRVELPYAFQETGSTANGYRLEPGTFNQDIFGGKRNLCFAPAHNSANADGREPSPSLIMQMLESNCPSMPSSVLIFQQALRGGRRFVVANFVVIESMERMAELEHHVVRTSRRC